MTDPFELVSPEKAAEYMKRNHPRNRPLTKSRVLGFAEEMKAGRWRKTHQGVAFDRAGQLIDGQHRLQAVVESGVSVWLMVVRGIEDAAFDVMDTGQGRKDFHRIHMGGVDITREDCSTMKAALCSISSTKKWPLSIIRERYLSCREAFDFVNTYASAKKVPSTIRAVILRAFYNVDRPRLVEFCAVIANSEVSSNGDGAAVKLVKLIGSSDYGSQTNRKHLYAITERALGYFLTYQVPGNLKPVTEEQYLLPWERELGKAS